MWRPAQTMQPPQGEPITLEEAKEHCREDGPAGDAALRLFIQGARANVEKYCGIKIAARPMRLVCDSVADLARLPISPIGEIASIEYTDRAGEVQTVPADAIIAPDPADLAPGIGFKPGAFLPNAMQPGEIVVNVVAGFAEVPPDIKTALLMMVSHLNLNREATGRDMSKIPFGVEFFLENYRVFA